MIIKGARNYMVTCMMLTPKNGLNMRLEYAMNVTVIRNTKINHVNSPLRRAPRIAQWWNVMATGILSQFGCHNDCSIRVGPCKRCDTHHTLHNVCLRDASLCRYRISQKWPSLSCLHSKDHNHEPLARIPIPFPIPFQIRGKHNQFTLLANIILYYKSRVKPYLAASSN